jgi:O-antigen/teichoic acid export membrane protein
MNHLKIRKVLSYLEVDRSILYGLLVNAWSFLTGPISMLLMIKFFSLEMQGYYYTFGSIIALRVFFESGFGIVIVSFVSKEWAKLSFNDRGEVEGDLISQSNLFSLSKIVFKWHFVGGIIALLGLGIGGYFFFSTNNNIHINWEAPWVFVCIFTVINMWLLPSLYILEGCNQIKQLYLYRFIQGICTSTVLWTSILLGLGLWSSALSALAGVITLLIFISYRYKSFFLQILASKLKSTFNWKTHLLPMQWRIGITWISGYFVSSFFTPLIFKYQGANEAGKFGMTWSLFSVLGAFASTWVSTKIPIFGIFVAKKDYLSLDKFFYKFSKLSIIVFLAGAICIWFSIYFLNSFDYKFAKNLSNRFISPLASAILLLGFLFSYVTQPLAMYLRSHNKEPYFLINLLSSIMVGLLSWIFVKSFSIIGVVLAYTSVMALFSFPSMVIIWYNFKKNISF